MKNAQVLALCLLQIVFALEFSYSAPSTLQTSKVVISSVVKRGGSLLWKGLKSVSRSDCGVLFRQNSDRVLSSSVPSNEPNSSVGKAKFKLRYTLEAHSKFPTIDIVHVSRFRQKQFFNAIEGVPPNQYLNKVETNGFFKLSKTVFIGMTSWLVMMSSWSVLPDFPLVTSFTNVLEAPFLLGLKLFVLGSVTHAVNIFESQVMVNPSIVEAVQQGLKDNENNQEVEDDTEGSEDEAALQGLPHWTIITADPTGVALSLSRGFGYELNAHSVDTTPKKGFRAWLGKAIQTLFVRPIND